MINKISILYQYLFSVHVYQLFQNCLYHNSWMFSASQSHTATRHRIHWTQLCLSYHDQTCLEKRKLFILVFDATKINENLSKLGIVAQKCSKKHTNHETHSFWIKRCPWSCQDKININNYFYHLEIYGLQLALLIGIWNFSDRFSG